MARAEGGRGGMEVGQGGWGGGGICVNDKNKVKNTDIFILPPQYLKSILFFFLLNITGILLVFILHPLLKKEQNI